MKTIRAAIYAHVSSERQATAQTIASQLAALRERVAADGCALPERYSFWMTATPWTTLWRCDKHAGALARPCGGRRCRPTLYPFARSFSAQVRLSSPAGG